MQSRFVLLVKLIPAVLLLLVLALLAAPASANVQLVYPEPGSGVVSSRHLVLKLGAGEITGVVVTINGVSSDSLPVGTTEYKRAFRDFLILQPLWDVGLNQLTVETFSGEKMLESFKTEIFFAPTDSGKEIPKQFKPAVLHQTETERLCYSCHNMKPTEKELTDVPDKDNACYSCHKRMGNQKYVHGPVSTYACISCHPLNAVPKYAAKDHGAKLCFECHQEQQRAFKSFKFVHGPVAGDMCEICHDIHSSEYPGQLRQPVNKLCLSCHEQIARGVHVITLNDGSSHPISGKPDPSERGRGRELSCASCHDPHGGKARYYFVTGNDSKMELCQMCHKK